MGIEPDVLAALATKADLTEAIAVAVAPLATKAELAAAIAPLATKAELAAEGERTRRHFDVVAEQVQTSIRLIAEGYAVVDGKIDAVRSELEQKTTDLDRRVTRLEAKRTSR